jgi:hypothetical protein
MSKPDWRRKIEEGDLKHAVGFAATLLPGECREEFDNLVEDLSVQHDPVGPAEKDAVQSMADAIWRKQHLNIFQQAFEARMKLGSHFEYPGDPNGYQRKWQEDFQWFVATSTKAMGNAVTKMVEIELAKSRSDSAEASNENGKCSVETHDESVADKERAPSRRDSTKNTDDHMTGADVPRDVLNNLVQEVLAEVKRDGLEKSLHGAEEDAGIFSESISKVAEDKFRELMLRKETDKAEVPTSESGRTEKIVSALGNILVTMNNLLGGAVVEEIMTEIQFKSVQMRLAQCGDLLTPECYTAQLRLRALLDETIERNHDRLIKLQVLRAKRAKSTVISLQPRWAMRKR